MSGEFPDQPERYRCPRSFLPTRAPTASNTAAAAPTLYAQIYATARRLMVLGPKSFHPAPKVDSAVVVLDTHPPTSNALDLINASFRMRRKKLVNNLIDWRDLSRADILAAMLKAGIDEGVRAETMSLDDFNRLHRALLPAARGEGAEGG